MAIWQGRSKKKPTGGRLTLSRKKRRFEIGKEPVFTFVGSEKRQVSRVRGANVKVRLLKAQFANVVDPATNKEIIEHRHGRLPSLGESLAKEKAQIKLL